MRVMGLKEKVSKLVVVTMASALVISSMFTDYGFATHANETVDAEAPNFDSVSDSDNIMMAAEPIPLYDYVQPTNNFTRPDISNPFLFAVYANKITRSDHIEGNMAVGVLNGGMSVWGSSKAVSDGGVTYIGDLSAGSFVCNVNGNYIVIPETNPLDGTSNKMVLANGQGYRLCKINASNVEVSSFITDTKLYGFAYQNDIMSSIASTVSAKAAWSNELYNLPDMDTNSGLVLNVTADELNSNFSQYERQIVTAAESGGKTVIINVTSGGAVTLPHMNANGASDGSEYAAWAGRVLWNLGKASSVSTGRVWGFILAPNASVANGNNIVGGVIADSFEQTGEVHQLYWVGVVPSPEPSPTPEPTPEPTPGPSATPEPTPTPIPDPSATPEPTPSPTPGPSATPGPNTTPEPTPGPSATPGPNTTPEPTPGPSATPGPNTTPEPTPGPSATPGPNTTPEPTPGPNTTPEPTPGPNTTPEPTPGPNTTPEPTPGPDATPEPTPGPDATPEPTPGPDATPEPTPGPDATPEPTPEPNTTPEPTPTPTVTPPPAVTEPPTVTQPPTVTDPPIDPPAVTNPPQVEVPPTPDEPETTPDPPEVLGRRRARTVRIDDDDTPLSDAMVLGKRRRPQTGDESDAWMMMFLASLSALAAWIFKGIKK